MLRKGTEFPKQLFEKMVELDAKGTPYKDIASQLNLTRNQVAGQLWRHHKNPVLYVLRQKQRYIVDKLNRGYNQEINAPTSIYRPEAALWEPSSIDEAYPNRCRHESCRNTKQPSKPYCNVHLREMIDRKDGPHYLNVNKYEVT